MYKHRLLNVTPTVLSPNVVYRILRLLFDVSNSSSKPRPLVIFPIDQKNPNMYSKDRCPPINSLLSGKWLKTSNCGNEELILPSSLSSFISKYADKSQSLCANKIIIVDVCTKNLPCPISVICLSPFCPMMIFWCAKVYTQMRCYLF